jgi:hypothetical protein
MKAPLTHDKLAFAASHTDPNQEPRL